jgi:hypothetical protein
MNFAILGGFNTEPAGGWVKEGAVAVLGGGDLDFSLAAPGPDANLTAVAIFGGINVVVPPGVTVEIGGYSLFGWPWVWPQFRRIEVDGDGPVLSITAFVLFGTVTARRGTDAPDGQPGGGSNLDRGLGPPAERRREALASPPAGLVGGK